MNHYQSENDGIEEYEINLPHYRQKNTWDCGLSCIMMILSEKNRHFFIENFDEICKIEGFGKSTWTIDLCYLMKKFALKFIFYTAVIGINPHHSTHFFYEKILPKDEKRVIQRFRDAKINGIEIKEKSIKTKDLISHLRWYGPIIMLINAEYLSCDRCKKNNVISKFSNCMPQVINYHGHYITLCGFNLKNKQFYYRNPAYSNRVCAMEYSAMNKARLCFGTDEDCIFIFNKN